MIYKIFLALTFLIIISILFISANVKTRILNTPKPQGIISDTIVVHFIHGSKRIEEDCDYKKERLGGYLGGHVEIEVAAHVYGFSYDSLPINYFPRSKFNSKYEKRTKEKWLKHTKYDKVTSLHIPVNTAQKQNLIKIVTSHHKNPPYDYSFWGQRCTSSAAIVLSDAKIIGKLNNTTSIISFYYPKLLRRTLLKLALKNDYLVKRKPGIDCYNWE